MSSTLVKVSVRCNNVMSIAAKVVLPVESCPDHRDSIASSGKHTPGIPTHSFILQNDASGLTLT